VLTRTAGLRLAPPCCQRIPRRTLIIRDHALEATARLKAQITPAPKTWTALSEAHFAGLSFDGGLSCSCVSTYAAISSQCRRFPLLVYFLENP